jgi:hypothetical protein
MYSKSDSILTRDFISVEARNLWLPKTVIDPLSRSTNTTCNSTSLAQLSMVRDCNSQPLYQVIEVKRGAQKVQQNFDI